MDKFNENALLIDNLLDKLYFHTNSEIPLRLATSYLQVDYANLLEEHTHEELSKIIKDELNLNVEFYIDLKKAQNCANIRANWNNALKKYKITTDISSIIGYALSDKDLKELATLHKKGKYREKIEDLLEDINYHSECGDFMEGRYDRYIDDGYLVVPMY